MKELDEMMGAAEHAVKLLCKNSKRPFDDFDKAAARLGNAADALMTAIGGDAAAEYWARMNKAMLDKIERVTAQVEADKVGVKQ